MAMPPFPSATKSKTKTSTAFAKVAVTEFAANAQAACLCGRACDTGDTLCATIGDVDRAGIIFISKTRLAHSRPSATANDTKIAPATPANPIVFSMAVSPH
jgi:hypothetical protein